MTTRFHRTAPALVTALLLLALPGRSSGQEEPDSKQGGGTEAKSASSSQSEDEESSTEDGSGESDRSSADVDYAIDGQTLVVSRGDDTVGEFDVPCSPNDLLRDARRLYVACGPEGLLVYDVSSPEEPNEMGFRNVGGEAIGVFEQRGEVWAEVVERRARPVSGGSISPHRAERIASAERTRQTERTDAADQTEKREKPTGETDSEKASKPEETADSQKSGKTSESKSVKGNVVEVRPETVVVDFGADDGITKGDHVELYRESSVDLGSGEEGTRETTLGVGLVAATSQNRSEVRLGVNETVTPNDLARLSDKPLSSAPVSPPRPMELSTIDAAARPFFTIGSIGFGAVTDVSYQYDFAWPGTLEVSVAPFGLAGNQDSFAAAFAGSASMSFDTRMFRIGLGAGATTLGRYNNNRAYDDTARPGASFQITQVLRLGARDGLHLKVDNAFSIIDREFIFAGLTGEVLVPLQKSLNNTWLLFRGGGHQAGHTFGELGLRVLTYGNGANRSLFLTPLIGFAEVMGNSGARLGGPMVGIDFEWRL